MDWCCLSVHWSACLMWTFWLTFPFLSFGNLLFNLAIMSSAVSSSYMGSKSTKWSSLWHKIMATWACLHTCQPSRILRESPAFSIKFLKNPALTISPDGNGHSPGILRSPPAGKLHLTKLCFTPFSRVCHASPPGERQWPLIKVIKTHLAQSNWLFW